MKTTILALAAMAVIGGCAGVQTSTGSGGAGATAAARPLTYYCAKDQLDPQGDDLKCNWYRTANEACRFEQSTVLLRSAMSGDPQPAGRCITGQTLVKVTPR